MSLTVFLARHGTHDEVGRVLSGRSEIALNQVGRVQAECLAARLVRSSIEQVHTSPRRRAKETAEIVTNQIGGQPITIDALDEIDFGEWTGRSFANLEGDVRWRLWNAARGRAPTPSGETMATAAARALRHLEASKELGVILCVSHCDIIRSIVAHCLGLDLDRLLAFDVDPASVTIIELNAASARVIALNERSS